MSKIKSEVKDVNITIGKRMAIFAVGGKVPLFKGAVTIEGINAVDPGHIIYNMGIDLYPNVDSSTFTIFTYKLGNYCLVSITATELFTKDNIYPLINGLVYDVEFYANGNAKYREFDIVQSGKIGTSSEFVYSIYNNGILWKKDLDGSIDDVLLFIDRYLS